MLMQELGKFKKKINIIANNIEKYMLLSMATESEYVCKGVKVTRNNFN